MAAALLPVAQQAIQPVAEEARAQFDKIKEDPILWVSNFLIKAGSVVFLLGVASYFLARSSRRAAQGYITDIDNTLGLQPESPPTPPRKVVPVAQPPPPPPPPPQVVLLNGIVADINTLGTANASANVTLLQDVLSKLWALARFVYGDTAGTGTQQPPADLGVNIAIAIMQTCTLIFEMEGRDIPSDPIWTWAWYESNQAQVYAGDPPMPLRTLTGMTASANEAYSLHGAPAWSTAFSMLSNTANTDNYKITINTVATGLNATQPFNIQSAKPSGSWGILGTVVSDLSAIGVEIEQGAQTVGSDIENAVVTVGNDVKNLFTEVGQGLAMIGKAIVNLPRLSFDSVGYAFSWAGEMVFDALYTPMLIAGAAMAIGGSVLKFGYLNIWPRAERRIILTANASSAKLWNRVDRWMHSRQKVQAIWTQKSTEGMIESANADPIWTPPQEVLPEPKTPSPPSIEAGPAAEAQRTQAEEGVEAVSPTAVVTESAPATEISHETPPLLSETPVPPEGTTAAAEAFLGENPTKAPSPEELRIQEANRIASLPPPQPTYRQRKEEREHEQAERLLTLGSEWGEV